MNYTNVLGYLLFIVVIVQLVTGILLSFYYSPTYTIAFDPVFHIMIDVKFGLLIRFIHVTGSSLVMLLITAHVCRGIWIRLQCIDSASLIWLSGWILFVFFFEVDHPFRC